METIYYGGKIITMSETTVEEALAKAPEALVVRDGLISAVGDYTELNKSLGVRAKRVDLQMGDWIVLPKETKQEE